nr:MAG TPA: hypothetical protein [Crassvirales sp.]DAV61672.1 MAG TPA: hypothetical protein [Caudoviricetes sp.]
MFTYFFCFLNCIKVVIVIIPEIRKANFIYTFYHCIT